MTLQKIKMGVKLLQKILFFNFSSFPKKMKPYVPLDKTLYLLDYVTSDDTVLLASRVFLIKRRVFFLIDSEPVTGILCKEILNLRQLDGLFQEVYWHIRRENMFLFFNNVRLLYYLAPFKKILLNDVYTFYNIFFNIHFYKNLYIKNYHLYKNVHLLEYMCKFYYLFESNYFLEFINLETVLFDSLHWYYAPVIFFKKSHTRPLEPVEFFPIYKHIYKNNFYSYIYKNTHVHYVTGYKKNFLWENDHEIDPNYFLIGKCNILDNYSFEAIRINKKINFFKFTKRINFVQNLYLYRILVLLFFQLQKDKYNNKFF